MKINFPLLSALVIGFLPVSTVFGQNTSEPVYTITSESLLDNHCIDTPPLGDRFGWNGYCSCVPEGDEIAYEWGHVTALIGDQLIATSRDAPGQCLESGTLSIYDWRGDQPPVKTQELISSMPGGQFGNTTTPLGTFRNVGHGGARRTELVSIIDGLIAVRSRPDQQRIVTIFKRTGEQWRQEIILQPVGQNAGALGDNMLFLGTQYFLIDDPNMLTIYNVSDWTSPQQIPIDSMNVGQVQATGDGFVVSRILSRNGTGVTDYYVRENGVYRKSQTMDGVYSTVGDNYMISTELSPLALHRTSTITTRELNDSGVWVDIPEATMVFENFSFVESEHLVNDQLVLSTEDGIRIYNFTDSKVWNLVQQININSIAECNSWCNLNAYSTQIHEGRIIANNDASAEFGFNAHTIYERSSGGAWTELQTIVIPQSQFYTPHFSLIGDYALAEQTASLDLPDYTDRSTVSVFKITGTNNNNSDTTNDTNSSCDYSNADQFGGWGWNAAARESCAPLDSSTEQVSTAMCIDSDGDGYGWNGTATCTPTTNMVSSGSSDNNCDYSDADLYGGWGWNASVSQSCAPLDEMAAGTAQCIDADGDGYGWNGVATCEP